jgi:uncharacterized protein
MPIDRRGFLRSSSAATLAFAGLGAWLSRGAEAAEPGAPVPGLPGRLIPDPAKILDLPEGFSYTVVSRAGETMDDGFTTPVAMDGMGAFAGPDGQVILVRNHEIDWPKLTSAAWGRDLARADRLPAEDAYDRNAQGVPAPGGTTTIVYDPTTKRRTAHWLSLAGTVYNCAGGVTPWNSWLTCEETTVRQTHPGSRSHGWVFEVPVTATPSRARPEPLTGLGRFRHEAAVVDATDGAVYLTEDLADGLLYRFVPKTRGDLRGGGRLQALVVEGARGLDTSNHEQPRWPVGERRAVSWIDLDDTDAPEDDLRKRGRRAGAAIFARGEGLFTGSDGIYLTATIGGSARKGQVWRLDPGGAGLALHLQPNDGMIMENCDNITVAPFGHLILCEDMVAPQAAERQYVVGVTPAGQCYRLARNALNGSEFAGACFAPDGSTLFVNIYQPGLTLAITGPWPMG